MSYMVIMVSNPDSGIMYEIYDENDLLVPEATVKNISFPKTSGGAYGTGHAITGHAKATITAPDIGTIKNVSVR